MPHQPHSIRPAAAPADRALSLAFGDALAADAGTPAARRFARRMLACLLAAGGSAAIAATATPPAPPAAGVHEATADAPRPPSCAERPLPPAIRELALPADQLARVGAALRAACERDQQLREEERRTLATLLTPEQMRRIEGRMRPPPPCRDERDAGAQGR